MEDFTVGLLTGFTIWIIFTSVIAYLNFFGIYLFKWKTLSSSPFLIEPREEGITIQSFTSSGLGLKICGITTRIVNENEVLIKPSLAYQGETKIDANAISRGIYQTVGFQFSIRQFSGDLILLLKPGDSPSIYVSSTFIPDLSVNMDFGDRSLARISNLALLVIKSLLNSHLMFPRFLPCILSTSSRMKQDMFLPLSLFNENFLQIRNLKLTLPAVPLDSVIYAQIQFYDQKIRTESLIDLDPENRPKNYSFPLVNYPSGQENDFLLQITFYSKRRRMRSSLLFECPTIHVKLSDAGFHHQVCAPLSADIGGQLEFDWILLSADLLFRAVPEDMRLEIPSPSEASSKYLDGLNWGNLKLALESITKTGKFNASTLDVSVIKDEKMDIPLSSSLKTLVNLREYEARVVDILKFIADYEAELAATGTPQNPIDLQYDVEAFHTDIKRMIKSESAHGGLIQNINPLVKSFVASLSRKLEKAGQDIPREIVDPIEEQLKAMMISSSEPLVAFSESDVELEPLSSPVPLLSSRLNLSVPNFDAEVPEPEANSFFEFHCHLGNVPVAFLLSEDSLLLDCISSEPLGSLDCSFNVMSLAESYGKDLSLVAIQKHQFTKHFLLRLLNNRLILSLSGQPKYFPLVVTRLDRVLRVRLLDSSISKDSNRAPFIEIEYISDLTLKSVECLKFFGCGDICADIYDRLQTNFIFRDMSSAEIPWASIEKVELVGSRVLVFFHSVLGQTRTIECLRLSLFATDHDARAAYCELHSKSYRAHHPQLGGFLGSVSMSSANSSTSSLASTNTGQMLSMAKIGLLELSRHYQPKELMENVHVNLFNLFGISCSPKEVSEFSCSFFRRGLNSGRLFVTPKHLCFYGKRNGVKTSKMFVSNQRIEYLEYAVKWFSKGLEIKFDDIADSFFFFGFKRESIYECYNTIHDRIDMISDIK